MNLRIPNDLLALTPIPNTGLQKVNKPGIVLIDRKVELIELKVVITDMWMGLEPGASVWVRGDAAILPWAKEIFRLQDLEFILVPRSAVMVISLEGTHESLVSR